MLIVGGDLHRVHVRQLGRSLPSDAQGLGGEAVVVDVGCGVDSLEQRR